MNILSGHEDLPKGELNNTTMMLNIKENVERGLYKIDVPLYNRSGGCLGIDYDNSKKQILIEDVSVFYAQQMIKQLEQFIKDKQNSNNNG
jgi:hypothetical protein